MATTTSKIVWRMGLPIKGAKGQYNWSPEFNSFQACANAYAKWVDDQPCPPRPIFSWRIVYVPMEDNTKSKA